MPQKQGDHYAYCWANPGPICICASSASPQHSPNCQYIISLHIGAEVPLVCNCKAQATGITRWVG